MPEPSPLRAAFDRVERLVGGPLEGAVNTEGFVEVVAGTVRALRILDGLGIAASSAILHRLNLPSHADLVELRGDVRRLEERLREVSRGADQGARPRRRPARPRP